MIILLFIGLKNGIENAAKNSILIILLFLGLKNGINPKERDFLNFVCFWNCQTFWYSFNQSLHHMDRAKVVLGLELSWTYSQSDSHKKAGHSPVRNGEKGWLPPFNTWCAFGKRNQPRAASGDQFVTNCAGTHPSHFFHLHINISSQSLFLF